VLLAVGFLPLVLEAFLFVAAPNVSHPMSASRGVPVGTLVVLAGFGMNLIGLAWMIRIYRADPEGRRSWWRFNRF
jgi:Flp pilus assembly protein TadB